MTTLRNSRTLEKFIPVKSLFFDIKGPKGKWKPCFFFIQWKWTANQLLSQSGRSQTIGCQGNTSWHDDARIAAKGKEMYRLQSQRSLDLTFQNVHIREGVCQPDSLCFKAPLPANYFYDQEPDYKKLLFVTSQSCQPARFHSVSRLVPVAQSLLLAAFLQVQPV